MVQPGRALVRARADRDWRTHASSLSYALHAKRNGERERVRGQIMSDGWICIPPILVEESEREDFEKKSDRVSISKAR